MKGKHIPPCVQCRRDTPPLGETVCRRCQAAEERENEERDAKSRFYAAIDEVEDPNAKQALQALFDLLNR